MILIRALFPANELTRRTQRSAAPPCPPTVLYSYTTVQLLTIIYYSCLVLYGTYVVCTCVAAVAFAFACLSCVSDAPAATRQMNERKWNSSHDSLQLRDIAHQLIARKPDPSRFYDSVVKLMGSAREHRVFRIICIACAIRKCFNELKIFFWHNNRFKCGGGLIDSPRRQSPNFEKRPQKIKSSLQKFQKNLQTMIYCTRVLYSTNLTSLASENANTLYNTIFAYCITMSNIGISKTP